MDGWMDLWFMCVDVCRYVSMYVPVLFMSV